MGGVLAVLFWPWLERLEKRKVSHRVGSVLLTFIITVALILPSTLLIFSAARTGFQQIQTWKYPSIYDGGILNTLMSLPKIHGVMLWVSKRVPMNMAGLTDTFQELAGSIGGKLAEFLGGALSHLPGLAMALALVVVSVYFFLMDGRKLIHFFRTNSIFTSSQTDQLISTVAEMCRSVILAALISGALQAVFELIACVLVRVPNAGFIGLLVFVGSFIPIVGSVPITLGVALQQLIEGNEIAGIILLIMVVVIMAVDNTVRPWFLKGSANLHPLLAFVAAFGGLQTLGFLGVFLGPILAALFIFTVKMLTHSEENPDNSDPL